MAKGEIETTIFYAFLLLITLVVFFGFFGGFSDLFKKNLVADTCQSSVSLHSALKFGGSYEVFKANINCPAEDLNIVESLDDSLGQQRAKQQIADALVSCYDRYGKGDVVLFDGPGVYCGVCHWITFEDKGKLEGLNTYLATTKAPNKDVNYLEFLSKQKLGKDLIDIQEPIAVSLNSDQLYSTVFIYAREDSAMNRLKQYLVTPKHSAIIGALVTGTGAFMLLGFAPTTIVTFVGGRFLLSTISSVAGGLTGAYESISRDQPDHTTLIALVPHEESSFEQLGCEKFISTK